MLERLERVTQGPAHKWWALAVVLMGLFLSSVDSNIVNLALPTIASEYRIGIQVVEWVAVSYFTVITVALLTVGRLADRLGRKRVYLSGFVLFTASSALCGAAPGIETLIGARVLQALGAACLFANGNAITGAVFPLEERGRALGFNASMVAVGSVLGLSLGGFMVDAFGWRSIFLINVPVGVAATALGALVLREDRLIHPGEHTRTFDLRGAVLSIVTLSGLLLAFERSTSDGSIDLLDVGLFVVGLIALVLLIRAERQRAEPLIDLGLFRRLEFLCGITATLIAYIGMGTVNFLMPFYVQNVLRASASVAGVLLTPYAVVLGVAGPISGWLSDKIGSRLPASVGLGCAAAAMLWLSSLGADSSHVALVFGLLLLGLGMGLFIAPNNRGVLLAAPRAELGMSAGLLSASRYVGRAIGISITASIIELGLLRTGGTVHGSTGLDLARHPERLPAFLWSQSFALEVMAGLLIAGVVLSLVRSRGGAIVETPARAG